MQNNANLAFQKKTVRYGVLGFECKVGSLKFELDTLVGNIPENARNQENLQKVPPVEPLYISQENALESRAFNRK